MINDKARGQGPSQRYCLVAPLAFGILFIASFVGSQKLALADGGRIAFEVGGGIYTMAADGSDRVDLTRPTGSDPFLGGADDPSWSPDGSSIVYVRSREERVSRRASRAISARLTRAVSDIYAISADGSGQRLLRRFSRVVAGPRWAPNATRIAYARENAKAGRNNFFSTSVYAMNSDGSREVRLTPKRANTLFATPAWSPDGTKIAFSRAVLRRRSLQFRSNIQVMNVNNRRRRTLIRHAAEPAWSPDGSHIAFTSTRDRNGRTCGSDECTPNAEIYVARADGSKQRRLTRTRANESSPSWSPNGSRIAFASDQNQSEFNWEIFSMRADGSCRTQLTNSSVSNASPAWRPGDSGPVECRAGLFPQPTIDVNLDEVRSFKGFPLYYLGESYRGLLLADASVSAKGAPRIVYFDYSDCGLANPKNCPPAIQVSIQSSCARDVPLSSIGGDWPYPYISRGALAIYVPEVGLRSGDTELFTGNLAIALFGANRRQGPKAIDALVPIGGAAVAADTLPPPALPSDTRRALKRVVNTYKKKKRSVRAAAKALGISRSAVRYQLRLAKVVDSLGELPPSSC